MSKKVFYIQKCGKIKIVCETKNCNIYFEEFEVKKNDKEG